jgi:hypothetical protein
LICYNQEKGKVDVWWQKFRNMIKQIGWGNLIDKGRGGHVSAGIEKLTLREGIWTVGILDIDGIWHLAGGFAEKTTV